MQLLDDVLRPLLESDIRDAWNPTNLYPDAPRTALTEAKLPTVRVQLEDFQTQATGAGAASRDVIIPHIYRITGTWKYPTGGEDTVSREQAARWNELVAVLTSQYPTWQGWRYSEEIGGEFEDDSTERIYTVAVVFTVFVVSSVRT